MRAGIFKYPKAQALVEIDAGDFVFVPALAGNSYSGPKMQHKQKIKGEQ